MSATLQKGFRLGPWNIEPLRGAVTGPNGEAHHVEPKVMDVLTCLAKHAPELVTRNQLLEAVWSGHAAADELLTRAISELRRVLQDGRVDSKCIETVPKRGYRLIGEVRLPDSKPERNADRSKSLVHLTERKLRFATTTVLVLALVYVAFDWSVIDPAQEEAPSDANSQAESVGVIDARDKSIAVLPFVNMSDDPGNAPHRQCKGLCTVSESQSFFRRL